MTEESTVSVPRGAPEALYRQVKAHVLGQIASGALRAGDRVPSEQELVSTFGVARMTVNRALRELAEQGSIVRVAGVGSFVAEDKPQSTLLRVASIAEEIRGRGHTHRFALLTGQRASAPMEVAASLQLQTGDSVFHLVGVHYEDDVAVQLEDRWVNPRLAPQLLAQDFAQVQPGDWLVRNVPYDEVEHVVDAMLPSPWQAEQLQMPATEPCLMLTRRTWQRGQVVTFVRCLHPGSRYRLGSRFKPGPHDGG